MMQATSLRHRRSAVGQRFLQLCWTRGRASMTVFEFVFSLYSLLFGLALAQVFGGFGNALQERHKIRVGWLTPLLGLFVTFDITSFWEIAWELKDHMDMSRPYFLY